MNWEIICKAVLVIFAVASAFALASGRADWLVWLLVAGLSLGNFNWYAGTIIDPPKIVTAFGLVYLALNWGETTGRVRASGGSIIYACSLFVGVSIAAAFLIQRPDIPVRSSGLQSVALRPFVQAYSYCSFLGVFLLVLTALTDKRKISLFCDVYVGCALCSSAVAAVQLLMLQSGREFMPIMRWNATHSEMAAFAASGTLVPRLYAFAGEPKNLAAIALPAVFMVLTALATEGWRPWWARWWVLGVVSSAFLFTFSTAAFISFALGLALLVPVAGSEGAWKLMSLYAIVLLLCASAIAIDHVLVSRARRDATTTRPSLVEILYARVVGRVAEEGNDTPEHEGLEYLFEEEPIGLLAGLGPGMFAFHTDRTWDKGIDPIVSGWVSMLVDLGIAGTGLWLIWLWGICRRNLLWIRATRGRDDFSGTGVVLLASLGGAICLNAGILAHLFICMFAGVLEAARLEALSARESSGGERAKPGSPSGAPGLTAQPPRPLGTPRSQRR